MRKRVGRSIARHTGGRPGLRVRRQAPVKVWLAGSPTHHGSGSRLRRVAASRVALARSCRSASSPSERGRIAGAESRPRTFSMTTHSGCRTSIPPAMCAHRPERVPGARPARLPTVDTSWHGNPPVRMSTGGVVLQSIVVMSPRFGVSGPVVGEDAGDGLVDFGEPDRAGIEDFLDGKVESAVAGEHRPDP